MDTRELMQDNSQKLCALWDFNLEQLFNCFSISQSVPKSTNATNSLCEINKLMIVVLFHHFFKSTMNKTDLWNRLCDFFVFNNKVKMKRFWQNWMLWSKWYYRRFCHYLSSSSCFCVSTFSLAFCAAFALAAAILASFSRRASSSGEITVIGLSSDRV